MKKIIRRLVASVALVGLLSATFAVPAYCGINTGGAILRCDMGNEITYPAKVGGEVASVQAVYWCNHYETCDNLYYRGCNQYLATGTSSTGPETPYTRIMSATPAAKMILANAATALGYAPGDAFGIEIGKFVNWVGYTPNTSLAVPMHFEIHARPRAGYVPAMLALLPNGAVVQLNPLEFDQLYSNQWYLDGTHMYYLHTMYPDAVYMMVHIPM